MRKNTSYSVSTKAPERAEFVYSNSIYKFRFTDLDFVWDFEYMDNPRDIFKNIANRNSRMETRLMLLVDLLMQYRDCWYIAEEIDTENDIWWEMEYEDTTCLVDKERADRIIRKTYEYAEVILWSLTDNGRVLHMDYYTLAVLLMTLICQYTPEGIVSDNVRSVLPKNPDNFHLFDDWRKRLFVI